MEIAFRNIPLARSGHSDKRGKLSVGMLCMIPSHSFSRNACIHYKNTIIGCVRNLNFVDMKNGEAELRGDIIFDCSYGAIAEVVLDEVYPVALVSTTHGPKGVGEPYLDRISLSSKDEREFEDQQPLDFSDLRNLVSSIKKPEAPAEPQGDTPYIYTPGMDKGATINWLNSIISDLHARDSKIEGIKSTKEHHKKLETELGEIEEFLSKTIRA